jgi:hypothetical protein
MFCAPMKGLSEFFNCFNLQPWVRLYLWTEGLPRRATELRQGFNPGNRPPRVTRPDKGRQSKVLTRRKRGQMDQLQQVQIAAL